MEVTSRDAFHAHDWLRMNSDHQPVGRILEDYWKGDVARAEAVEALTKWILTSKRMDTDDWREYAGLVDETFDAQYIAAGMSLYLNNRRFEMSHS